MHEYDVKELNEELASLPPTNNSNNNSSNKKQQPQKENNSTETSSTQQQQQQQKEANKAQDKQDIIIIIDSDEDDNGDDKEQQQESFKFNHPAIYPFVEILIDQLPAALVEAAPFVALVSDEDADVGPKRKRTRRVYVANFSRCATLRSRQNPPAAETTEAAAVKATATTTTTTTAAAATPATAAQTSPTPTEPEENKYIKLEFFKPEFWNCIEEDNEPEGKSSASKRRGGGGKGRKRRKKVSADLQTVYSAETAAAIAAAQLELDSLKPAGGRSSRKRTCTMSLYDRSYQTSDDRRVRSNGYGGNAMRAGPTGGSSDVEAPEIQSHQYYGSGSSGSNSAGGGSGTVTLNGSASTLNHAPAMGTLCNIGNTCYLNSVVYTLRFAPSFVHNLHHLTGDLTVVQQTKSQKNSAKSASLGRAIMGAAGVTQLGQAHSWSSKDLASSEQYNSNSNGSASGSGSLGGNSGCSKPSHQLVTEKLHELYHSLHGSEMADSTEPYHAGTLLHAIQDVNSTFEGNQQQDAHEFLMCVLNCIRETNQALLKAIADSPELIAHGYIANPDETDASDAQERSDSAASSQALSGINANQTTSHSTTTKTSFFSRKSKRKDEAKSLKVTRLQSPLKDNVSGLAASSSSGNTSNSLFYLNTVDLSSAAANTTTSTTATPAAPTAHLPAKYSSDDEMSTANQLKDKMLLDERIRELNLNFFSSDFEGIVVLTTKCLSCETITRQKQGMLDISVPVPISGYENADFNDNPSAYIQNSCITREYFRGENKYSCNQCTGYTEAIRSISYEVLPRLLVIQLNRFSGGMEKVSTYVPTTFTLPCFCAQCCELGDSNKLHVYKLYSVITHVGATLTVGHYIAYTCFLDLASDYTNCPKDRRNMNAQQHQQAANENAVPNNGGSSSMASTPVTAAASALASSGTSLLKKVKFGRSKASSSGDMSKNVKQLNGVTSKTITNGLGKLSMNTTCHSVNCCAMRICCGQAQLNAAAANTVSTNSSDLSEESLQNGHTSNTSSSSSSYPTGYGSTGRGGVKANYIHPTTEPIWYMCDDDKIKAMSQREFEELLSPTRKITITPYLLFYARFDLQPPSSQQAATKPGTSSTPPPPPPQSSWSNDNLQGGLHKM